MVGRGAIGSDLRVVSHPNPGHLTVRTRVDRVEEGLREVNTSLGKNSMLPTQDSIRGTKESVGECQQGMSRLEARVNIMSKEIDMMKVISPDPSAGQGASERDLDARLTPISTQLKALNDRVGDIQSKSLELEALRVKMESAEKLSTPQRSLPTLQVAPATVEEASHVSSPHPLSPALNALRRHHGSVNVPGTGEPTTPSQPGLGFVSRLEFENTMKRVEERAREAVEKEVSAKKMTRMALADEDLWSSWRRQRESAERALDSKVRRRNVDLRVKP